MTGASQKAAHGETIVRIVVRGRVQGVGYRAFIQSQAQARGITGWVRNRRNGDVEAILAGPAEAINALCEVCREGPPHAIVETLEITPADRSAVTDLEAQDGFVTRPTF
ncbi:MAG TPA: acylphosphatase [Methylovirgula sp.]